MVACVERIIKTESHNSRWGTFFNRKVLIVLVFLKKNVRCGYLLRVLKRNTSNEYPQHMFSSRNKKNILDIALICSYADVLEYLNALLSSFQLSIGFKIVLNNVFSLCMFPCEGLKLQVRLFCYKLMRIS